MMRYHRSLIKAAALLLTATFAAGEAHATTDIFCTATDGSGASIQLGVGTLPILAVISARATDGSETWSTDPQGGERAFSYAQGFIDERELRADFTDPNIERVVVSLRVVRGAGDKTFAQAGVLDFENLSVFPVSCEQ